MGQDKTNDGNKTDERRQEEKIQNMEERRQDEDGEDTIGDEMRRATTMKINNEIYQDKKERNFSVGEILQRFMHDGQSVMDTPPQTANRFSKSKVSQSPSSVLCC